MLGVEHPGGDGRHFRDEHCVLGVRLDAQAPCLQRTGHASHFTVDDPRAMGKDETLISAIGAVSANGMIGLDGWLPWDIPEELAYFERTVAGAALVIGRLTYESMDVVPEDSFIVSRRDDVELREGCTRVSSVEEGLQRALATGRPVFVIGGASIYAGAWRYCHRFYLTRIERDFHGDSAFPGTVDLSDWRIEGETLQCLRERRSESEVRCRFLVYRQNNPQPLPGADCNRSGG